MIKDYNIDVQTLFLRMMVTNSELFTRVINIMNAKNFERTLRPVAEFIVEHTEKYSIMPDPTQIKATTGVDIEPIPELYGRWAMYYVYLDRYLIEHLPIWNKELDAMIFK